MHKHENDSAPMALQGSVPFDSMARHTKSSIMYFIGCMYVCRQLIPEIPELAQKCSDSDGIGAEIVVQNGPYKAKWLHVVGVT